MRTLVALLVVAGGLSALVEPADAQRSQRAQKQKQSAGTYSPSSATANPVLNPAMNPVLSPVTNPALSARDANEAMRARYADPSGDYAGLPDWARAALGAEKPRGR